jgi:transcriptional regulator with XRE-family HTH domain
MKDSRLRTRRKLQGLTREQLAHLAGVSVRSVARYENEGHKPGMKIAERLARVLNCTVDELFNGGGDAA